MICNDAPPSNVEGVQNDSLDIGTTSCVSGTHVNEYGVANSPEGAEVEEDEKEVMDGDEVRSCTGVSVSV